MRMLFRRGLYLSLCLALCFSLASCDSSGSSSSGDPKWVGDWKLTDAPDYWLLTEDELEIRRFSEENSTNCVDHEMHEITESSSDEFTLGRDGDPLTIEVEGSGDELTFVLDGGTERTLRAVDSVPDCPQ